jgi:hypothetical protein
MSLFDTQNFAEITHPDYPGERLVCCRNPVLAEQRARKREALLDATEQHLNKIIASVQAGRLRGADRIGIAVGKVINKHKVAKHLITTITDDTLTYHRDQPRIAAEAALDGIYVIRTSLTPEKLNTPGVVEAYKNLAHLERDFRSIKIDDLDLRPIRHYLPDRVRAHIFLCMLAAYLTWHLRHTLAPLTFTDENIPPRPDPVAPAQRSPKAKTTDASKKTPEGLPTHDYQGLITHLESLTRNTVSFAGQRFTKLTDPTPVQTRAFELLDAPIPLTLTGT